VSVDGVPTDPDSIETVRTELIEWRNAALEMPSPDFQMALLLSHAIVMLYELKEMKKPRPTERKPVSYQPTDEELNAALQMLVERGDVEVVEPAGDDEETRYRLTPQGVARKNELVERWGEQ
jgi:hypothetical protein